MAAVAVGGMAADGCWACTAWPEAASDSAISDFWKCAFMVGS